ncbi:MAG: type II secretion system F family protein [Oscillospiraceae bacterium]|nr:type II secretion system F family protein [Oscillospiraceae bacterium]
MRQRDLANSYLSALCMELSMLLESGIAFSDGILMLQDDEKDKGGKAVLQSLLATLEKGEPLSAALKESAFFPRYMISMVEIGEKTGRLAGTLKALSEHYSRQERLAISIKSAVLYPAILLVLMVAVVLVLIVQVLPIFNDVFTELGSQMSPLAASLVNFGGWLGNVSAVLAAIIGAIFVVAFIAWIVPSIRRAISKSFSNMFGDKSVFAHISSSRFTSAMTLAVTSGLDTDEAVTMAAAISGGSKAVDKKNNKCIEMLRSGGTLADAMRDSGILSARDSRMLSLGGRSGMVDSAMAEIARRSEIRVQDEIDRVVGKIEPTLVVITSAIVGVILLSVMMPLMGIMTSIG